MFKTKSSWFVGHRAPKGYTASAHRPISRCVLHPFKLFHPIDNSHCELEWARQAWTGPGMEWPKVSSGRLSAYHTWDMASFDQRWTVITPFTQCDEAVRWAVWSMAWRHMTLMKSRLATRWMLLSTKECRTLFVSTCRTLTCETDRFPGQLINITWSQHGLALVKVVLGVCS